MYHVSCHPFRHRAIAWLLTACVLSTLLVPPHLSFAQGHTLTVTLRDGVGQPVPAITVLVRSPEGVVLARQQTDARGQARFTLLPATVLVQISGQPRSGPPLYQIGNDVDGVLLTLDPGGAPTALDLRVEPDGMVLPDPLTMIDLQEGGPTIIGTGEYIPTLPLATPFVVPSMSAGGMAEVVVEAGPAPVDAKPTWVPFVSLLIVLVAMLALLWIQRRRAF
jgi:hypothetical protein